MAKTKNGRLMNPTDAFRKEQRKKQVNRNKLERKFQREAHSRLNNASSLKDELTSILHAEENGTLNKTLRLKKKVLQDAFDHALKKQKETEVRAQQNLEDNEEDLNSLEANIPIPLPPPLPPGPPPSNYSPMQSYGMLPPPPGPPTGFGVPSGLSFQRSFPLPMQNLHMIPVAPPPKNHYTSPPKPMGFGSKECRSTIEAATTVKKRPLAQNDKTVTSMVPASVRVKRDQSQIKTKPGSSVRKPNLAPSFGSSKDEETQSNTAAVNPPVPDKNQTAIEQKMNAFLHEVQELGAFD